MANKPVFSDEQLSELVARGKLSPATAESAKSGGSILDILKGGFMNPMDPTAEAREDKLQDALQGGFALPEKQRTAMFNPPKAEAAGPELASVGEAPQAVDSVDPSLLATPQAPQAQTPAAPVDIAGSSGLRGSFNMQKQGVQQGADAAAKGFEAQAEVFKGLEDESRALNDQVKNVAAEREAYAKEYQTKAEAAQKELLAAEKVNPNRYWQNKNTGSKIAAVIGLILGGVGGALTGQKSAAQEVLNKAIDDDIGAQKDAYERLKGNVGEMRTAYSTAMNIYGDKQTALLAAKASALEVANLKLKQIESKTGSEQVKAVAKVKMGEIGEELGKIQAALGVQGQKLAAARMATVGPGVEDPSLLGEEAAKRVVRMPNGLYKPAISEAAAKTVNEVSVASQGMRNILKQMRGLNSPSLPYSEKVALADALKTEYILQKKTAEQLGVLSAVDKEMVESTLGNPGGWRPGRTEALIDLAEKNLENKLNMTYQTYVPGFKPLTKGKAK